MDYAVAGNKTSELTWEQVQALRKQKKSSGAIQSKADKKRAPRLRKAIKGFADGVAKTGLFLIFVFGAYHGYRFLTTSTQFAINEVTVKGNRALNKIQLLENIQPLTGQNIFLLNLSNLSKELSQHPWVRKVSLERVLPQTLRINVVERAPYARIQMDRIYVLDNFGVLLCETRPEFDHLPLISGMPAKPVKLGENVVTDSIIRGLHTMHYLNRIKSFQNDPVETLHMVGNHRIMLSTRHKGTDIYMDLNMLTEGFRNLKIFLETFADGAKNVQFIDLSFKGKIIVKHATANNKEPGPQKL